MDLNDEHNYQTYEGKDYSNVRRENDKKRYKIFEPSFIIDHGPRKRNLAVSYKETDYYKQIMGKVNGKEISPSIAVNKKTPREFNASRHSKYKFDFQFVMHLDRLHELEKKTI